MIFESSNLIYKLLVKNNGCISYALAVSEEDELNILVNGSAKKVARFIANEFDGQIEISVDDEIIDYGHGWSSANQEEIPVCINDAKFHLLNGL